MFREGDTTILMLDYTINGDALQPNVYQEIELQLNKQNNFNSVKKLLSDGGISWQTVVYIDNNEQKTFTGFVAYLTQEETFKLRDGKVNVQLRIMADGEVGSSDITQIDIGDTLSTEVLREAD